MGNSHFHSHETQIDEDGVIKIFDQRSQQYTSCDMFEINWPANDLPDIESVPSFTRPQEGPDPVFGIENLVFEGGGVKGMAYAGAIRELEKLGVLGHVKRIAGASVGSIVAMAMAVNYPVDSLVKIMKDSPLEQIFEDGDSWVENNIPFMKKLHSFYHLHSSLGVYPGHEAYNWLGDLLKEQTGSADITFSQVYERYGRELCIVVGNITLGRPEWFHVKTYPNFPVRRAVRMSMSIPFFFKPWREHVGDSVHWFTDGGVYCNFPIHVWDGWLLSMKKEDEFQNKLHDITDPLDLTTLKVFSPPTNRTLGFKVYNDGDVTDLGRFWVHHYRLDDDAMPSDAESNLAKGYRKRRSVMCRNEDEIKAYKQLLRDVSKTMKDKDRSYLTKNELLSLTPEWLDGEKMFESMDHNVDDMVSLKEVVSCLDRLGYHWRAEIGGNVKPVKIKNIITLGKQLVDSLSTGNYRRWFRDSDRERTISIDVRYIGTTDFNTEEADKKYCLDAGSHAVKCWARDVKNQSMEKKENANLLEKIIETEMENVFEDVASKIEETVMPMEHTLENFASKIEETVMPMEHTLENIMKQTRSRIIPNHTGQ